MDYKSVFYPESRFGGYTDVDGTIAFYCRVRSLLSRESVVLDVGCGVGSYVNDAVEVRREMHILKGRCARVIGMDVDPEAARNPSVDEFRLMKAGEAWPVETGAVDLVVADFVMEHVEDPDAFLAEGARVLRAGGCLCMRTANAISYIGLASRMIPNRLHRRVLATVQPQRDAEDVFPTVYRCNTVGRLRRAMRRHGFGEAVVYGYEAEPSYLGFSGIAYWLGVMHQKLAPKFLKPAILVFGRKG